MRKIRNVLALALSLVLCFGMSMTAFAYDITITDASTATVAHEYAAYQIFTGTFDAESGTLSDIKWGANATDGLTYDGVTYTDAAKLAEYLADNANGDATAFAAAIGTQLKGDAVATATSENGTAKIEGLADGYYLVKDITDVTGELDTTSAYIISVAGGSVNATAKAETVTVEKKVIDTNDTTGVTSGLQDSADYDIGDEIPFQLSVKVASDYMKYTNAYKLVLHDVESEGLTFEANTVKVSTNLGAVASDKYTVVTDSTDGCKFEIVFDDLKEFGEGITDITVEYKSVLNEKAVVGAAGNPNKVKLQFSNDIYGDSTGETPYDTVIVFTFKTVVNKVTVDKDGNTIPLAGAEFKLQKKIGDEFVDYANALEVSEDGTIFTATGLDDGTYKIVETKAPAGYNSIEDIVFVVVATHDEDAAEPKLQTLVVTDEDGNSLVADAENGNLGSFEVEVTAGEISTDVVNLKGAVLPSTGGIGVYPFIIGGSVLVIGAVVLLIVKKKMTSEEE